MLSLITPTGDRPDALQMCAHWMSQQTYSDTVQWIIINDGNMTIPAHIQRDNFTVQCMHRLENTAPSVESFVGNLRLGMALAAYEKILIIEDDDYYAPTHLETLDKKLDFADVVGNGHQLYYHFPSRRWAQFKNKGACLCQTGFRSSLFPQFKDALNWALAKNSRGVDARFWDILARRRDRVKMDIYDEPHTVVGLKGYPGRPGLGIGHQPDAYRSDRWTFDENWRKLDEWLGADAQKVKDYARAQSNPVS